MATTNKPAAKKPAANKPAAKKGSGGCTPISVEVAILFPDDKHEVHFGLTKGCNPDNTAFWIVDFLLKEQKGDKMVTRIEIHVHVGKDQEADAKKTADQKRLSPENEDLLSGPAADRAKALPPGSPNDKKLNKLVLAAISDN